MKKSNPFNFWQPLGGSSVWLNLRLFRMNRLHLTIHNFFRIFLILFFSTISRPIAWIELLVYRKRIAATSVQAGPIFIVGHWRSGTTFLHNLISQDPQFGFLNFVQAICPDYFLRRSIIYKRIVAFFIPRGRPHDKMEVGPFLPQEDEFALANMSHLSCYHSLYFPGSPIAHFERYLSLDDLEEKEKLIWKEKITWLYKKLTYYHDGKTLVMKNPPHTARVSFLKSIYPKAKFVYIVRDPFDVFASTREFVLALMEYMSLQKFDREDVISTIRNSYVEMLKSFEKEFRTISEDDRIAIHFDHLVNHPIQTVQRIYQVLGLQNFEDALPLIERYQQTTSKPRKKTYRLDEGDTKWLEENWIPIYRDHLTLVHDQVSQT